ncbi:MAG: FHA domain-containing protein [Polaromonas sp.]|nr:FHA domain-containing protein [Polaromonas sp.]
MTVFTVVFADLSGSMGVFESLGNAKATEVITRLTQWIGLVCISHGGLVVKNLGDGVLMVFKKNADAVDAVVEMQRVHTERIKQWPEGLKMRLQIGLARGDVVAQDGDYFGDAVNLASRLSDLSGPDQILATESVIDQLVASSNVRSRCLGAMDIRGRDEACTVYRVEWQNELLTEFLTMPASLTPLTSARPTRQLGEIELSWLDVQASFNSADLPIFLGRVADAQFVVTDPRVSRLHAKITWRAGKFYIEDISSFGTWVRFAGAKDVVSLRRNDCVLLLPGELALGGPFEDFTVPTVSFTFPSADLADAFGRF